MESTTFIYPTSIFSFPQAMALETVVLARKVPGNESVIKHNENGLLFETPEVPKYP